LLPRLFGGAPHIHRGAFCRPGWAGIEELPSFQVFNRRANGRHVNCRAIQAMEALFLSPPILSAIYCEAENPPRSSLLIEYSVNNHLLPQSAPPRQLIKFGLAGPVPVDPRLFTSNPTTSPAACLTASSLLIRKWNSRNLGNLRNLRKKKTPWTETTALLKTALELKTQLWIAHRMNDCLQ